jgi:hypothetical protein
LAKTHHPFRHPRIPSHVRDLRHIPSHALPRHQRHHLDRGPSDSRQIGWVHQILVPVFPDQAVLLVGDSLIGQLPPSWVDPQAINLGIGAIGVADVRTHLHELDALSSARTLVLLVGTNNLVGQSTLPSGLSLDIEQLLAALPDKFR